MFSKNTENLSLSIQNLALNKQLKWMKDHVLLISLNYFKSEIKVSLWFIFRIKFIADTLLKIASNILRIGIPKLWFMPQRCDNPHSHLSTLHKRWSFPLIISSVNVTKSAISCGFGHIYWRNP